MFSESVQQKFQPLSEDDVLVDPQRKLPILSFWLNKKNYNSQQALLWCLSRTSHKHWKQKPVVNSLLWVELTVFVFPGCDAEQQCSVADLRDTDSAGFFSCVLHPNSRVCGAYDKPLRRPCPLLLDKPPNNTYSKTGVSTATATVCGSVEKIF